MLASLPRSASFTHAGARDGYEAVCFRTAHDPAYVLEGGTSASEDGVPWSVQYRIAADESWRTTRVLATGVSPSGWHDLSVEVRHGRWRVDGVQRPDLDGCVDVDFESSLVTNTLAVHRIDPAATGPIEVPAAFVRADDLRVERMEQTYRCVERREDRIVCDYTSTTFGFSCTLVFDGSGLVVDYPGLGHRSG